MIVILDRRAPGIGLSADGNRCCGLTPARRRKAERRQPIRNLLQKKTAAAIMRKTFVICNIVYVTLGQISRHGKFPLTGAT